jgi:phenylalanyl-tRNA synthetase beta chain
MAPDTWHLTPMKISYTWLKEMVETDLGPREIAERLTMAGLAVDTIEEEAGDAFLEFDITSNRPDALSHLGIAREAAALTHAKLHVPRGDLHEGETPAAEFTSVEILDPDLCPRYSARVVRGVKVGPSPDWLVRRLEALGMRSINNVADVTNYVLLEQGHPLHAFDFDTLEGRRIVVRRAHEGERLVTLEKLASGEEFRELELEPDMLVIADAERAVALAGVKGGKGTGITETTTSVLLESAYFLPASVRKTARALRLDTDASYRFERGADFNATVRAIDRAAALIAEVAGGEVARGVVDAYPSPIVRTPIPLRRSRAESLLGIDVPFDRMVESLRLLGFAVEPYRDTEELLAVAPSYRVDVSIEEDLVEEVGRAIGYDTIPSTLPDWSGSGDYLPGESRRRAVRSALVGLGFDEAISLSFVERALDDTFGGETGATDLLNPVLDHKPRMRRSLLPGLVEAFETNAKHGTRSVRLFEIGKRFVPGGDARPEERETLGLLMSGSVYEDDHRSRREVDFYDLKGAIEEILERLRIDSFTFDRAGVEYLHRGQAASVVRDGQVLGAFGRIDPDLEGRRKLKQPVFVAEIELDRVLEIEGTPVAYRRLPRFPSVVRDVSVVVPRSVGYAEMESAVRALGLTDLVGLSLYDIFTGGQLPEGHHSVTLRATFRSDERTLTDEEVSASHARIVDELGRRFGATLR